MANQISEQDIKFKRDFFINRIQTLRKGLDNSEESGRIKRIISGYTHYLNQLEKV